MTAQKKPVINRDLWEELDEQVARHTTQWSWTKGHASHEDNNRADELASLAARKQSLADVTAADRIGLWQTKRTRCSIRPKAASK